MSKELLEAVQLFISQPLNNPLSRGQIMEVARIALPILEQQEQGYGEWIEWGGGERPVDEDAIVEMKWKYGDKITNRAGVYSWSYYQYGDRIIAYRIIDTNQNGEQ